LPTSPCAAEFYEFLHTRSNHRHNHVCQIFSRSVQWLRSSDTPELPFPIDLPLQQCSTAVRHCDPRNVEPYDLHASEPELDPKYVVDECWLPGGDNYDIHERPANFRQGDQPQNDEPTETEEPTNPVQPYTDEQAGPILDRIIKKGLPISGSDEMVPDSTLLFANHSTR